MIYFTPSKIFSYAWCELERTIDEGRYPLSLRVQALRAILAKLGRIGGPPPNPSRHQTNPGDQAARRWPP